jgi:uncharacterized protein YoxC
MVPALSSETTLPGEPTAKKRRVEEYGMDDEAGADEEDLSFTVPENKTPRDWEKSFREGRLAYLKLKEDLLTTKGYLIAKDTKLLESHAKIYKFEGLVAQANQETIQAKQEVNRIKEVVNHRDKTINELEHETQNLKLKIVDMTAAHDHLVQTVASSPAERHANVPTYIPTLNDAVRNHKDYPHPHAPRQGLKNYRRFTPTLPYASGNGKVAPGRYGSNANWDLGLCHVHFQTPQICEHGNACEYRHHPLNQHERQYMRFLTRGMDFLSRADEIIMRKTAK